MLLNVKLVIMAILWGGTFSAGRIVARHMEPFTGAFLRYLIASLFLVVLTRKIEGRFPKVRAEHLVPIFLLGMTGVFAYNVFFFKGLSLLPAGRASIIIATNPVFISLLSACFFKERLTVLKIGGMVLSFAGAIIAITRGSFYNVLSSQLGWGDLFLFFCVVSWVSYSLIVKKFLVRVSPLVLVTYSTVVGTIALAVPALLQGFITDISRYPLTVWGSLFYMGFFGTVLGFLWYYEGIQRLGAIKTSVFINFVPVTAIAIAFFLLGESISPFLLIGAFLVTGGVSITNVSELKRKRPSMP